MKKRHILTVMLLAAAAMVFSQTKPEGIVEINDLYTDGNASGYVHGGIFTQEGWKTTSRYDYIQYDIRTAAWARAEFDVKGLYASNVVFPNVGINKNGDEFVDVHYTLFNSYDRDDDDLWMGKWMPSGVRQWHNPYKAIAHLFGYVEGDRWKWKHGRFRLNVAAYEGGYDNDPHAFEVEYGPVEWKADSTYHVVLEWGAGAFNYYIDDVLFASCDYSGFGEEYAPPSHSLRVGSSLGAKGFGHQVPQQITFSNFKFTRYEDLEPPRTTSLEPLDGSTGVDVGEYIGVNFNESLDSETALAAASITPAVAGEWKTVGTSVYYELHELLQSNTTYTVTISTELTDFSGNALPSPVSYSFTTGDAVKSEVGKYRIFDLPMTATNVSLGNRYTDSVIEATFTGPSGQSINIDGFWDGANIWRVRMAPTEEGVWTYNITSNINELNKSGSFTCIPSDSKGFIQKSETLPYTFEYTDGTPWLWKGDTSWRGTTSSIPYETRWKSIIDLRASQGYNAMQFILVSYINGDAFWRNEGGPVFELGYNGKLYDKLNPGYFRWVDRRIEYALNKGIVPVLFFTWAQEYVKFSQAQFDHYMEYLVARFSAYNVIWIISGEYNEVEGAWAHHGQVLKEADPYDHPVSLHPSGRGSSSEFGYSNWMDFIFQQWPIGFHTKIKNDYKFDKPVVNGEYAYAGWHESEDVRIGAWEIYTAGGSFTAGFFNTFAPDKGGWDMYSYQQEQDWVKWSYEFMDRTEWWDMDPHDDLVSDETVYCLADPGDEYIIYAQNGGQITVDLSAVSGEIKVQFFDPYHGDYYPAEMVNGGGTRGFTAPFSGEFVLHVGEFLDADQAPPGVPAGLEVVKP